MKWKNAEESVAETFMCWSRSTTVLTEQQSCPDQLFKTYMLKDQYPLFPDVPPTLIPKEQCILIWKWEGLKDWNKSNVFAAHL